MRAILTVLYVVTVLDTCNGGDRGDHENEIAQVLHPTPYTLHPTPYTLHPTPYTLYLTPYTLHPTPAIPTPPPQPKHAFLETKTTNLSPEPQLFSFQNENPESEL